jgi:hypothetical protein
MLGPDGAAVAFARFACSVAGAAAVLTFVRMVRRQDAALGGIVAAGVLVRAAVGAFLFWTSYLSLPFFAHLQLGDGFWQLAPDARSYYRTATRALSDGWTHINATSPSPTFLRLLAGWMWAVGVSPASGLLLNVALYASSAWLAVRVFRPRIGDSRPLKIFLVAYSFSPAAVLFSVQALKDQLVLSLALLVVCGMWLWAGPDRRGWHRWTGLAMVGASVFLVAGVRPYFAVLVIGAVAAAALTAVAVSGQWRRALQRAILGGLVVVALWVVFAIGAGPYYRPYRALLAEAFSEYLRIDALLGVVDDARSGFVASGGDTNIADEEWDPFGFASNRTRKLQHLTLGLGVTFVPIHLVQWMTGLSLRGGRGLLLVTDVDTAFLTAMTALALWYAVRRRAHGRRAPGFAVFCAVLGFVTIGLMAYVVTNFGTLFRLRLFALMVVWLLPLAFASSGTSSPAGSRYRLDSGISPAMPQRRENCL